MKKENYILIVGVILSGILFSHYIIDPTLTIRHISLCLITLVLSVCLFCRKKKDISVLNTSLFAVFVVYCVTTTLSAFKAVNLAESLNNILAVWVLLIFFVCVAIVADKEKIAKWLVFMGLGFGIYSLYGLIKADNILSAKTIGFTVGRNLWSSSLMLLLPFSLYVAFKNKSYIAIFASILLIVNIICLQTRSVYLAIIIATTVTVLHNKKLLIFLAIGVIACFCMFDRLKDTGSLKLRFTVWTHSAKVFAKDPILGVGAGNWKVITPQYGDGFGNFKGHHRRAHNDFLEVFVETGIFGGLAYIALFVVALRYTCRARDRILALTMRFGIISYMVFAFFSFPKERAFHSMIVLVMIGLLVKDYPIRKAWIENRSIKTFVFCFAIISFALFVNIQRYRTELYGRKIILAKVDENWY